MLSKNYLDILIEPLFQSLPVCPVVCCLNLNEALLAGKLIISSLVFITGSSL